MVIPGPNELTLDQLNKIMDRFMSEMIQLYSRHDFRVHGHENKFPIHSVLNSEVCDLPANRKLEGLASFSSKLFMCPQYPWRYIRYAFRAHSAEDADKQEIFDRHGVSWSPLNRLPGWLTSLNSVVEFMHCIYLCMVRHVTKIIILQLGMLSPIPRNDWYPLEQIDEFFSQIIWPVSVGRLPPSVTSSSLKADQWHLHISVLFVGLFVSWERCLETLLSETENPTDEQLDEINTSTMDRSIRHHYETVLTFSTTIQILSSCSISPDEIDCGCAALSRACQNWAHMGCHMTPYFHFAQHLHCQLLQFGLCYATWAFPYECNNGFLGRMNHNNHKGGELECTMMHKWWKWVLVCDLIGCFLSSHYFR
ncbi:uncharacterized protein BJ212DRAFT_1446573 [Suillus subaureus]|uniref:Uncharacterized protein n=1 Tax=Suillus subaureus TaxID=48587 RepID=A0A9P7JEN7_9AGAM|nr:uncharacterized protein BJ212DRAFT_1446573 [Suillus subaureus]KAG1818110.1 hypothetical protein BJ212DRAFT_1446573 [Suillus subaureus]